MVETPVGIDLWINLGSPRCYLTLVSLRKALADSGLEDQFHLVVHPSFTEPIDDSGNYSDEAVSDLAAALGIRFAEEHPPRSETGGAAQLVAYAQQRDYQAESLVGASPLHVKVADALMRSRFELGLDLADPDQLIGIGQDLGIAAEETLEALNSEVARELIEEDYSLAVYLGIQDVPVLLFDEQYLVDGIQVSDNYRTIIETVLGKRENR